jgi:hypothetical protein
VLETFVGEGSDADAETEAAVVSEIPSIARAAARLAHPTSTPWVVFMGRAKQDSPSPHGVRLNLPASQLAICPEIQAISSLVQAVELRFANKPL